MAPASVLRPAVAVLETTFLSSPPGTVFLLGRWLNDGTWADIEAGPGVTGLRESIREQLASPRLVTVNLSIQSYTGTTTQTVCFEHGQRVELPIDPDYESPGDEPAIQFRTWCKAVVDETWSTPIPSGWDEMSGGEGGPAARGHQFQSFPPSR